MRSLVFGLLLAACAPTLPTNEKAPLPPSLEAVETPTRKAQLKLRGQAPGALVVRITVDRGCAGPALLELSASELEAGVWLELIVGQNVFTASSISASGRRSDCSAPLEISRFIPPPPEPLANLIVSPGLTAATRTFRITGVASDETTVRLHRNSCFNDVEDTVTSAEFATNGFAVTFERDGSFALAFDAVDEVGQRSPCSTVNLLSKTSPPWASFEYGSPQPTPESSAWFLARGDFRELQAWSGLDCQGIPLGGCSQVVGRCVVALQQAGSAWVGPFSAFLTDALGNTACVPGLPYLFDENASTAPELFLDLDQLRVRVHAGRDRLELFASEDCSGAAVGTYLPSDAISQGLRDSPSDGGVFSARSYVSQTTPDPCSLPLYVP